MLGTITNAEPKVVAAPRAGYPNTDYQSFRKANLSRTAVAYVGANDGMLHGFKASDGTPVLSYVPRGVFPNLGAYTDPTFTHRMFVDGPIITADYKDGSTWKTLLVGALGSGGRGLFALDVTDPTSFKEASAASIVKFDYTAPAVGQTPAAFTSEAGTTGMMAEIATDLGHIVGDPSRDAFVGRNLQVARMRNDKWALIFGNGLNSVNERAALYILYLDGSGLRKLLPETATGQGNGLATPLPVDVDGDGRVDLVYAGDHLGRLWKFELAGSDDTQWKVAQISGVNKPVIDTGRPITSAPAVAHHPGGGLLVTFGTGRLLTDGDRNSTATETLYGVWDKPGGPHAVTDSDLVARTLSATDTAADGSTVRVRVLDASPTRVDYAKQRGWKIALGMSKERNIYNPIVQGRLVYYFTHVPASSRACSSVAQGGSLLSFDVISGSEPEAPVIDINGDGLFTTADRISEKTVMGRSAGVGRLIALAQARPNDKGNVSCAGDTVLGASGMICAKKPLGPGRRAWRDMRP